MCGEKGSWCCGGGRFPTFAVAILAVGVLWLLNDLNVLSFQIPWVPVVLIVIALSWIVGHYSKK